jgi:hypothetical protein
MRSEPSVDDILADADYFLYDVVDVTPIGLGAAEACFVRASKESYERASFLKLDEFDHRGNKIAVRLPLLMNAMIKRDPNAAVHHIFNTGFCCSTLLGRALGALGPFLVLREAQVMDALNKLKPGLDLTDPKEAEIWYSLLRVVLFLLGRTYPGVACTVAKADEFSGNTQRDLLRADMRSRAVFLYSSLADFLPSILKTTERRKYAHDKLRLHEGDVDFLLPYANQKGLSDAEAATLGWLYEQYNYLQLISEVGNSRIRSVRAEDFLQAPARVLVKLAAWFGTPIEAKTAEDVASGSVMRTYSKDQDLRYDSLARQEELRSASSTLDAEIKTGLDLAEAIARIYPLPTTLPGGLDD